MYPHNKPCNLKSTAYSVYTVVVLRSRTKKIGRTQNTKETQYRTEDTSRLLTAHGTRHNTVSHTHSHTYRHGVRLFHSTINPSLLSHIKKSATTTETATTISKQSTRIKQRKLPQLSIYFHAIRPTLSKCL